MNGTEESLDLILSVIISDEPPCQFAPERHVGECSIHVVSLWIQPCTSVRVMGCAHASAHRRAFTESGGHCKTCDKPARDCWREIPI